MKAISYSATFYSADGRTMYVTLDTGERRRVVLRGGQLFLVTRTGKAKRKAAKRSRMAA